MPSAEDLKSGKETVESLQTKLKQNKGASRCRREHCCQKKPITAWKINNNWGNTF